MGDERVRPQFWELPIEKLNDRMERLCDRCGRCCLKKLADEDTGEIVWTDYLSILRAETGLCGCYRAQ